MTTEQRSHQGTCRCPRCGVLNSWRSDFSYEVGQVVSPGPAGRCRMCLRPVMQRIEQLTDTIEEAHALVEQERAKALKP